MCAATNPMRTSDMIAKFGWKIMPYLSNLGPTLLAEAQVLFVDHGHTNALDADDGEHGMSFEVPLDTIDYAIDLCTAAERSVILVAPGHNEPLAAATIDFDVSDITVIGIGEGSNRPTIDFDNTASQVIIGANNVHLINLRFMPSIDDIVIGVEVEAAVTGTILEKCEWAEMEDTGDEFILGLDIKAGCTDTKVTNCLFRTELTADGATHAIKLTGASDNVIIEKSRFIGNWSTAAIGGDTALSTDVLIDDCTIKTADSQPGIEMLTGTTGIIRDVCIEATSETVDNMIVADAMSWFNNYGVTADGTAAELIGGGEVQAALVTYNLDHLAAIDTGIDADASLSGFVVDGSILGHIMAIDANPDEYDASLDSLQAISERMDTQNTADQLDLDAILEDTITISGSTLPDAPVTGSLATFVSGGSTGLGQPLPASMSLIDIIGNFTGGYDGTEQDDNVKASLDLAHVELAKIKDQAVGSSITYFVDSDASDDTGDGLSWATAMKKIQTAVTAAADYDTIYVRGDAAFDETVTTISTQRGCKLIGVGEGKLNPNWTAPTVGVCHLIMAGPGWEVSGFLFSGTAQTVQFIEVHYTANGTVIKDNYFHGGNNCLGAVHFNGAPPQCKLLNNHITNFGRANSTYEAAVCAACGTMSVMDYEVIGNWFSENTNHLRMQMSNSLIKDNVFQTEGGTTSATVILDTVCQGQSCGGNCVVDNYFGDISANIKNSAGYYGTSGDLWAGNHALDSDDWGYPTET